MTSADDYAKVQAAAARGDRAAQRALANLAQAAADVRETTQATQAGAEKGLAEAERRYGRPPTGAA